MISKQDVEHIARLARIELTEKEKEKFQKELSSILGYVEKLSKVNTKNVGPIGQVTGLENVMREDRFKKDDKRSATRDKLIREAPKRKRNYIKVPKVLE